MLISYHILSSSSSLLVFTKMCFCACSHLLPSTFYCIYKGSVMYCCFKKKKKNSKKKNSSKSVEQLKWYKNLEQKRKVQFFLFGHHKKASTVQSIRYRVDITKVIWYPACFNAHIVRKDFKMYFLKQRSYLPITRLQFSLDVRNQKKGKHL